jgi:hypothetical protein
MGTESNGASITPELFSTMGLAAARRQEVRPHIGRDRSHKAIDRQLGDGDSLRARLRNGCDGVDPRSRQKRLAFAPLSLKLGKQLGLLLFIAARHEDQKLLGQLLDVRRRGLVEELFGLGLPEGVDGEEHGAGIFLGHVETAWLEEPLAYARGSDGGCVFYAARD